VLHNYEVKTMNDTIAPSKRYIPVADWATHHQWPPIGGLRHLIFHADTNGFNKVVKRVGRRVLIDEAAFFDWVESQNQSREIHHD
jgi:hypothetical protein